MPATLLAPTTAAPATGIVKITTNGRMDGPLVAYQSPDGFIAFPGLTLDQNTAIWRQRTGGNGLPSLPSFALIPVLEDFYCPKCREDVGNDLKQVEIDTDQGRKMVCSCRHCGAQFRIEPRRRYY